jgi:hypothetical protein
VIAAQRAAERAWRVISWAGAARRPCDRLGAIQAYLASPAGTPIGPARELAQSRLLVTELGFRGKGAGVNGNEREPSLLWPLPCAAGK